MNPVIEMLHQMEREEAKYPELVRMGLMWQKTNCIKCLAEYRMPWKPGKCDCLIELES